jgi:tetratricopeptide (TPR) repeat protein
MRARLSLLAAAALASAGAWAADTYIPGSGTDPNLRAAQYQSDEGRYFSALTELLSIDHGNSKVSTDSRWLLAEDYLSFGMRDKAEPIYRELAVATTDHLLLGRSRLRLAEFSYERGYFDEARSTLLKMQEKLPKQLVEQWQDQMSRVLMAQGRYNEAVSVLTNLDNAGKQSQYTRYNLGVALIKDGRVPQGRDLLDRVGRMRVLTLEDLALRDKANLTLGWHFLHNQLGGSALPIFGRIRSQGPYANRALLGLGWAELSPRGSKQEHTDLVDEAEQPFFSTFSTLGVLLRPGFLDRDIFKRAGMRNFRLDKLGKGEEAALKRALVAWVELINRDPMDPAVQEGWLAIPYSLDKLGAHTQALQYYEKAVASLEENRRRSDLAMTSIRQGRMVETIVRRDIDVESGWEWKLKDLPDAPETYYLQNLLAEHRFQEALKNYRDVRLMAHDLDSWQQRLQAMEAAYQTQTRPEVAPEILFKRATEDWTPPWTNPAVTLRAETAVAAPGTFDAPFKAPAAAAIQLAPGMPKRYDGDWEKIQSLKTRLAALREILASAGDEQSKLLQTIAVNELSGQKKQIEKYLVEARFALARLYDRQMKGELNDK